MAAAYHYQQQYSGSYPGPYPVSAYRAPSPGHAPIYRSPSPAYQSHVDSMFQAAPMVYPMPVAPPALVYPMNLPGYQTPGLIQRSSSPTKQFNARSRPNTPVSETPGLVQNGLPVQYQAPAAPSITPTRDWLLDTLKRFILTNNGILIGDYPAFQIRKKDATDKFYKRVSELYPSDKYNITEEWIAGAMANREFLPEFAIRLDDFPTTAEFRVVIKHADFHNVAREIASNIEQYFNIQVVSNETLATGISKFALCFRNHFIPHGQHVIFYVEQAATAAAAASSSALSIQIPATEMQFQHDYLAYDGNVYSVLDTYNSENQSKSADHLDVDDSLALFEIVNNIRKGISVFMAHAEMEKCIETILAARQKFVEKKEKQMQVQMPLLMFDKVISSRVRLDFYVKVWEPSTGGSGANANPDAMVCSSCNVDIESGDLVCSTKCCRQMMHPSCLLELYLHEDCNQSEFRCDKCSVRRTDKYGRNTEVLMGLLGFIN